MSHDLVCPKCGAAIPKHSPEALCASCALEMGLNDVGVDTVVITQPAAGTFVRYIGDYELLDEIGRGGMGVVYRARQVSLNRIVAVKMILAGQFAGPADRQRFQREAEAVAQLRHPSIVSVHEVGEHEGRSYFSMDFIEGRTLANVLRDGKLPPAKAASLVKTIAEAVQYAHDHGTLHRDLKPQNILITADGQPHILDFGLARSMTRDTKVTCSGDVVGSPSYMSPEQAAGRAQLLSPATDVYGLGAILYQAITGHPPFIGETAADILIQVIQNEPTPPRQRNRNLPADLETICLKCLEKQTEARYSSAREVAEELQRFLNFEPIRARPASSLRKTWSWSQQNPWAFAGLFGLLALALVCIAYGFWEKMNLLKWRLEVGKNASLPTGESPAFLFMLAFPGLSYLVYLSGKVFRRLYRRWAENGEPMPSSHLLFHGSVGVVGTIVGIGFLLLQIRSWVWQSAAPPVFILEIVGFICALAIAALGFRMVWESVGLHETSRFRGVVDKTLEQQLSVEARQWPVLKLVGFALWLGVGGVALAGMVMAWFFKTEGPDLYIGLGGMLLSGWISAFLVRAFRQRRRLLTFVYLPIIALIYASLLGLCAVTSKLGATLLLILLLTIFLSVFAGIFLFRDGRTDPGRRFPVRPWIDTLYALGIFVGVLVLIHVVENWRGRREWVQVQAEFAGRGESLDLASFLKPVVPDGQNVMEHPYMKTYFRREKYESALVPISHPPFNLDFSEMSPFPLATLQRIPRQQEEPSLLQLLGDMHAGEPIPLLQYTNQALIGVFSDLARRAGVNVSLVTNDAPWRTLGRRQPWRRSEPKMVTIAFTNLTALQALDQLSRHHLLVADAQRWADDRVLNVLQSDQPSLDRVLAWYEQFAGGFAQIEEALQRPYSRLPHKEVFNSPLPNFVSFRVMAQAYATLCKAHLLNGEADQALTKLQHLRRLADAVQANEPPTLVEAMVRVAMLGLFTKTVEETMAEHLWSPSYLKKIQEMAGQIEILPSISASMRGAERAGMLYYIEKRLQNEPGALLRISEWRERPPNLQDKFWTVLIPKGWVFQNFTRFVRLQSKWIEGIDPSGTVLRPKQIEAAQVDLNREFDQKLHFRPYYILSYVAVPNFLKAVQTSARTQAGVYHCYLACALERYRAARGAYPETMESLVPAFAAKVPTEPFNDDPIRYRRLSSDKYVLYSVGWDMSDDGGKWLSETEARTTKANHDWVWQGVPKS